MTTQPGQIHFTTDEDIDRTVEDLRRLYEVTSIADVFQFAVIGLANSPTLSIKPPAPKKRGRRP